MRASGFAFFAPLVFLVFLLDSSCSSDEFQASGGGGKSGDSGVGGAKGGSGGSTGGDAGAGATDGSAATGGGGGCTSDPDCDDGLACNGKETCSAGHCKAGTAFQCTNPDAAHCSVACAEADGGTNCVVSANDADKDQHGDALCAQAVTPGDDCDDTNKDVYPGATETCNGIDDDCDGKDDLQEGFQLSGAAALLVGTGVTGAYQPSAVWGDTADAYGVAWTDERDGIPRVYFGLMSSSGAFKGNQTALSEGTASINTATVPSIAWSGT